MRLRFGDCAIDVERRELRRSGTAVHVEPQVFDLLLHFSRNRNQVVSKEQLLAAVWEGRIVSDSALSTRINAARHAIGDSGERQQLIQTIARRGFRFVAETEEVIIQDASVAVPERPSIAIMAFANMSDDPEQSYFAEGMAEDLITSLSHIRWLTVIARNSSFSYKGRSVDARQIGSELSVRYILASFSLGSCVDAALASLHTSSGIGYFGCGREERFPATGTPLSRPSDTEWTSGNVEPIDRAPRSDVRDGRPAAGIIARDAALFLSAESVMSTWRRELGDGVAAPEARVVSPGRLTTANR
jgi:DNA-binding winged helix-turn-helix (wHTH) protein